MKPKVNFLILLVTLGMASCTQKSVFTHSEQTEQKPWKHTQFDNADDKFSFAIFSDLTGGERPEIFKVAIEQLNLLRPELIVNVGDLIAGAKDAPSEWHQQWNSFDERANKAFAPIFYAGGNHDLTGQLARDIWKERNGSRYYHFRYKDVLFLVFDTEDNTIERMDEIKQIRLEGINIYKTQGPEAFKETAYAKLPERISGTVGIEQTNYFLDIISKNTDVRHTIILIHKPAWKKEGEQNFASIEKALSQEPYSVFYGHTHVYKYEQRYGRDYINLATSGGKFFPEDGPSFDHITWITIDNEGISMANLKMEGILDKTGHIPLGGDTLTFESVK